MDCHADLGSRLIMGINGVIIWLIGLLTYILSRHGPPSRGLRAGRVRAGWLKTGLKGRRKQFWKVPGLYPERSYRRFPQYAPNNMYGPM